MTVVAYCFTVHAYTHDVPHTSVRLTYHSNAMTKLKLGMALSVAINNIIVVVLELSLIGSYVHVCCVYASTYFHVNISCTCVYVVFFIVHFSALQLNRIRVTHVCRY